MDKKNIDRIFKDMMDEDLDLPKKIRKNYLEELEQLYTNYLDVLIKNKEIISAEKLNKIKGFCKTIIGEITVCQETFGKEFENMMEYLYKDMLLQVYPKISQTQEYSNLKDSLVLYRITKNRGYLSREDIFHCPYKKFNRGNVGRYGKTTEPCLYLGTSIELCKKEVGLEGEEILLGSFMFDRNVSFDVSIIELAVKPSDFTRLDELVITTEKRIKQGYIRRDFDEYQLDSKYEKFKYLYWYPLIAACSFINKLGTEPNIEYMTSNHLMDWIIGRNNKYSSQVLGLRYFSCALDDDENITPSEWGFNYVLPASENKAGDEGYCKKLSEIFRLTNPKSINENKLKKESDFKNMEERLKKLKYDKIKNEYMNYDEEGNSMKVKTWNNGKHHKSGSGYGVKINRNDRDKYFSREWKSITLCVGTQKLEVQLRDTFWTTCSEFRSKVIGEYLIENGLETWTKGKPNELKLEMVEEKVFKLLVT